MKSEQEYPTPAYPIGSVASALKLLLLFRDRPAIRVAEAGRMLGVARSTAHRQLAMLAHYGFVVQNGETHAYHPGPALVEIGTALAATEDVRSATLPQLESLVSTFGETAHVCTLRGSDVAFLAGVESPRVIRAGLRAGTVLPAHATSGGKALLAVLGDSAVIERYPQEALPVLTNRTIRTRTQLLRELHNVRERGFAINHAESEAGVAAYSCVVFSRGGEPRGAITISGPEGRMQNDRMRMIAALQNACNAARATIR